MFTGMKLTPFLIAWMLDSCGPARKVFSFWRGSLPTTVVCWSMVVTCQATKYSLSIHIITNSQRVVYDATTPCDVQCKYLAMYVLILYEKVLRFKVMWHIIEENKKNMSTLQN